MDISKFKDEELIQLYSKTIKELKSRNIIRTKNVLGDLAEFLTIQYYCKTAGLPNLQVAPIGTQNIDAISRNGDRYSIKATSNNTTGVFYGLQPKDSLEADKQKFEYIIICKFCIIYLFCVFSKHGSSYADYLVNINVRYQF